MCLLIKIPDWNDEVENIWNEDNKIEKMKLKVIFLGFFYDKLYN